MAARKTKSAAASGPSGTKTRKRPMVGYIDPSGELVCPPIYELGRSFSEGVAFVRQEGRWSLIDRAGQSLFDRTFDDATCFTESLAAVCVGKRWGYLSAKGELVIEPRFAEAGPFSEGLARVKMPGSKGKVGFIDRTGQLVLDPVWEDAGPFREGMAPVEHDAWSFVGRDGVRAFPGAWGNADPFESGWARVDGMFIDTSGKVVLRPPERGHAWTSFAFDRAVVDVASHAARTTAALARSQSRFGYVDRAGVLTIPAEFAHADTFKEGLALVNRGGRQNEGEIEGGRFAFIDPSGKIVAELPPDMDTSDGGLRCGRARHMAGSLVGFVDRAGAPVIPPRFKWALAFSEDLCCARE